MKMTTKAPLTEKEKTLASVFYNSRTGFGSVEHTYQAARKLDPSINRAEVRHFIANQEIRQRKKPQKANSFVADLPRQEFQVDLLDMGEKAKPRYGLVAVDIFTKKGACIPIRDKLATTTAAAMEKVFSELGYPSSIMSDEGGEFAGKFAELLRDEQVEQLKNLTGGRFVERFIRTLKKPIFERLKTLGYTWTKYVQDVVDKYNDSVHSGTKYTPDNLAEHQYDFALQESAYQNQLKKAKFPTDHPGLEVGDHVKIRIKQGSFYKETFNSWSPEVYTIERIDKGAEEGQDRFHLAGYRRPLLRFELLKVHDVQALKKGELVSKIQNVKTPRPPPAKAAAASGLAAGPLTAPGPGARPVPTPAAAALALRRPVTRSQA